MGECQTKICSIPSAHSFIHDGAQLTIWTPSVSSVYKKDVQQKRFKCRLKVFQFRCFHWNWTYTSLFTRLQMVENGNLWVVSSLFSRTKQEDGSHDVVNQVFFVFFYFYKTRGGNLIYSIISNQTVERRWDFMQFMLRRNQVIWINVLLSDVIRSTGWGTSRSNFSCLIRLNGRFFFWLFPLDKITKIKFSNKDFSSVSVRSIRTKFYFLTFFSVKADLLLARQWVCKLRYSSVLGCCLE